MPNPSGALLCLAFGSVLSGMVVFACGGGQPAQQGGGSASSPASSSAPAPGESSVVDSGPTTTTRDLVDSGDAEGTKLSETQTAASTSAPNSRSPGTGAHSHDPGRGPQDIRAIVVAHRDEARACYDKALKEHPGIEGDLVIQWTIDPKGSVTQVSLDTSRSQITEPSVVACVTEIIKAIRFASSPGGFETKAFYPFNFHPRRGSAPGAQ